MNRSFALERYAVSAQISEPVAAIEQALTQPGAIMCAGVGRFPAPDQPEPAIDGYVVLVAERRDGQVHGRHGSVISRLRFGELERPARVPVVVTELRRRVLPVLRNVSGLDIRLFGTDVVLTRSRDEQGVEDLPGHGNITRTTQHRIEPVEQGSDRSGFGEPLAEKARSSWHRERDPTAPDPESA